MKGSLNTSLNCGMDRRLVMSWSETVAGLRQAFPCDSRSRPVSFPVEGPITASND